MLDYYPVFYCGNIVGTLTFTKSGLYYHYEGIFQLDDISIYRVYAISPLAEHNLGVCIPAEGKWSIRGSIATNKLDIDHIHFVIHSAETNDRFIPLIMNQPFAYLESLQMCRFCCRDGQIGFVFAEEISKPSG